MKVNRWFEVVTVATALCGCAAEIDDADSSEGPTGDVGSIQQAVQKGPFGLSQEFNGRADGTFENVEAFIEIYPEERNGQALTRVDFRFWNGGESEAKIFANFVVGCEERPNEPYYSADEYHLDQYEQGGWGKWCTGSAKAAVAFRIDN